MSDVSPPSADELRQTLTTWLETTYASMPSEDMYLALSVVLTGEGAAGLSGDAPRLVEDTKALIETRFASLPREVIIGAVGSVAQNVDRDRRTHSASVSTVPAAADSQRGTASDEAYVRGPDYAFVRTWDARTNELKLRFDSSDAMAAFAERLVREQLFELELTPAPPEFGALSLELTAAGDDPIVCGGGAAAVGPGARVVVAVQHVPAGIRQLAARRRARISSAHQMIQPRNDPSASSQRPPIIDRPTREVPLPRPTSNDFGDVPTGVDRAGAVEDSVARRRRRAKARSTTDPSVRVEDEVRRVSGRRGRRKASTSNTLSQPAAPVSDTPMPATPPKIAPSAGPAAARADGTMRRTVGDAGAVETLPPDGPVGYATREVRPEPPPVAGPRTGNWTRNVTSVAAGLELGEPAGGETGDSFEFSAAALILRCAARYPAARLDVVTDAHRWSLAIREDQLIDIRTEPEDPRFSMAHAVEASGFVDPADLAAVMAEVVGTEEALGDALVRARFVRFRELDAITTARAKLMLNHLFAEDVITYAIAGFETLRGPSVNAMNGAQPAWEYLHGGFEDAPLEVLEAKLSGHHLDRVRFYQEGFLSQNALRLGSKARRALTDVLDGTRTATEVLAQSPLRRRGTLALLAALDAAGLLEWERMDATAARVDRAWPMVVAKHKALSSADPFELLETHWSADELLVAAAYRDVIHALDIEFIEAHGTEAQRALAGRVRMGLRAARDRLRTRDDRETVRSRTVNAFNVRGAVSLYERKAELSAFKGEWSAAVEALRRVVELEPEHGDAVAQLAAVRAKLGS